MHKLDRDNTAAPPCLSGYHHTTHSWDNFGSKCKKQLRAALVKMQGIPGVTTEDASEYGVRCAYCEDAIHHAGHIEHFRRKNKNHFPELTFDWSNLFWRVVLKIIAGTTKIVPEQIPITQMN